MRILRGPLNCIACTFSSSLLANGAAGSLSFLEMQANGAPLSALNGVLDMKLMNARSHCTHRNSLRRDSRSDQEAQKEKLLSWSFTRFAHCWLPKVLSMNSAHLTCCIHGKHTRLLPGCRESAGLLNWHAGLPASLVWPASQDRCQITVKSEAKMMADE